MGSLEVPANSLETVSFVLVRAPCYLMATPRHNRF
jgi:hypothetical protein